MFVGPPPTHGSAHGHGVGRVPGAAWQSSAEIRGMGRMAACGRALARGIAAGPETARGPGSAVRARAQDLESSCKEARGCG
jgi:hypothetical protein